MRQPLAYLATLFALLPCLAFAQDEPSKEPSPDWITPIAYPEIPSAPPDDVSSGVWYLSYSHQINHILAERYSYYAVRIVNASGVEEASTITVNFDPTYETVAFNTLAIHRDGKIIDRLDDQTIEILRTETDRERLVYSAELQAHIILDDIRPDDVVVYAYTISGSNPVLDGRLDTSFSTTWAVPLAHQHALVVAPPDAHLTFVDHRATVEWSETIDAESKRYEWEQRDPTVIVSDDSLPDWYAAWGFTEVSSFASWNEVSKWGFALYEDGTELQGALLEKAESLKAIDDPRERISAALRFCQDEIRYTSISIGEHNYKPYPLETVYERRFGDCKDKSRMLVALLRELGFDATPALVNTYYGKTLNRNAPGPSSFNHVIARLIHNGMTYWLDPTRSFQRGPLDALYESDYGYALVLDGKAEALERTGGRNHDKSRIDVTEHFEQLHDNQALLTVISVYRGAEADYMRSSLSSSSAPEWERAYLNHYANYFPKIASSEPFRFEDDDAANIVTLHERYLISDFLATEDDDTEDLYATFHASTIQNTYSNPSTRIRSMPIGQIHPKRIAHTVELEFHDNDWSFDPESQIIENEGFRFEFASAPSPKKLVLQFEYESLADAIDADKSADYIADVSKLEDTLYYSIVEYSEASMAEQSEEDDELYYGYLLIGATACIFSMPFALLFAFQPKTRLLDPEDQRPQSPLHGIAGWLIIVSIGICIRPLYPIAFFLDPELLLTVPEWESVTAISPMYRILLYGECLGQAVRFTLSIATLFLFFRKNHLFPAFFISTLFFDVGFATLDAAGIMALPEIDTELVEESIAAAVRSIIVAAIWVTYAIVSKRVKATFIY